MAAEGRNSGFLVLDDFVCRAIPAPSIPPAGPPGPDRRDGVAAVDEVVVNVGRATSRPAPADDVLRSEAGRVAALIAASADPAGTAARFHELLLAELDAGPRSAPGTPEV